MKGVIAKVARMAVSKAAAFGYAVAVGVAGNIAFHYVEPSAPPPATAASVAARPGPVDTATAPLPPPTAIPTVIERPEAKPHAPSRAAEPRRAVASAPVLPEPPVTVALPSPDALPPPALKPAILPREREAALPPPAPALPPPAPPAPHPVSVPADQNAAATPSAVAPGAPAPAALPPLGPAIDVEAAPTPPSADAVRVMPPPAAVAAIHSEKAPSTELPATEPKGGLEISDIWHPGRAVRRGLHWAGRQVPLIGDDDVKPTPRHAAVGASHAAVAGPIPLLPAADDPAASGAPHPAPPRNPAAPGPGSGGLY